MSKVFILDTNVLLHDPFALHKFPNHDLVIPITVIEEIDTFKKNVDSIGRNARHASRLLDEYRCQGSLRTGVEREQGGRCFVRGIINPAKVPDDLNPDIPDDVILAVALGIDAERSEDQVVFISKDVNMRIKANALGMLSENYEENEVVQPDRSFSGWSEITLSGDQC